MMPWSKMHFLASHPVSLILVAKLAARDRRRTQRRTLSFLQRVPAVSRAGSVGEAAALHDYSRPLAELMGNNFLHH